MGKGSRVRPYSYFRFGKNYDRIFTNAVRKGTQAKTTQIHINKKKNQLKLNPLKLP